MSFEIEFENGQPAKITGDTLDELQAALAHFTGAAKPGSVRVAKRRTKKRKAPKSTARRTANKTRGWGPEVYKLAKAKKISPLKARSELAAAKRTKASA